MTRGSGRRAENPAITTTERAAWLRVSLLEHYDADASFRRDLSALHPVRRGAHANREAELHAFAERYGLDRMERLTGGDDGPGLLRTWSMIAGPDDPILSAYGFSPRRPPARVEATVWYDPAHESRQDARVRLLARIDGLLDEGDALAKAQGYVVLHKPSRLPDYVRWLYERLRFGWSWQEIADHQPPRSEDEPDDGDDADAIRKGVAKIAKQAGVRLTAIHKG